MIDAVVIRRWLPVSQHVLSFTEIEDVIRTLLRQYRAEYALLFGSYARGEATPDSDLDVVVFGGELFALTDIFSFAEDLHRIFKKKVDVFEIRELNNGTDFYNSVMREGVKIAA